MQATNIQKGQLVKAIVISTGKSIQVYRRIGGGFVDYSDCTTVYKENELKF